MRLPEVLISQLAAFVATQVRFWCTVDPRARRELRRWRRHAEQIPDPTLRMHALEKLHDAGAHTRLATTFAVLAPSRYRTRTIIAIVALEVMYDYLDALTERSASLEDGLRLHNSLIAPFIPLSAAVDPRRDDARYFEALAATCRSAFHGLPHAALVRPHAARIAQACSEAQTHTHLATGNPNQLADWARARAEEPGLEWWELAAGYTGSVVVLHALIVAAADVSTSQLELTRLIDTYVLVSALVTLLDSVIDTAHDARTGNHCYVSYYANPGAAAERIGLIAGLAASRARQLRRSAKHLVTVAGSAGFYLTAPDARGADPRLVAIHVADALGPELPPVLWMFRAWRATQQLSRWLPSPRLRRSKSAAC